MYRLNTRMSDDDAEMLKRYAKKFGMTISSLSAMCLHAGLIAVVRSMHPEEVMKPEEMAKIVKAVNDLGVPILENEKNG